jgi:hypothetical protein
MTIRRIRGVRTQRSVGDPLPQKRVGSLVMRFFGSCALFVAGLAGLMAGGSIALSDAAPAGASLGITVNCPADNLQDAIYAAPAGSTLLVSGTCTGNFYINKDLTLSGPATLDGGGGPNQFGSTLNVAAGTVVLNNLVIQDGVGIDNIGGGIWNSSQLTLNHSAVTHNTAGTGGGVFNEGQLTLNSSTVSNNTGSSGGSGGIFNCGGDPGFESDGLCTGTTSLTLNNSSVSNNVGGFDGGGIDNDLQGALVLNSSSVSYNTASNGGTAGINNQGTATLNKSTISNNVAGSGFGNSGGLSTTDTSTTTINNSIIQANSAGFLGGGIFAGGPVNINHSIVTGNTAGGTGGGMLVWNGPTTVANSTFSNNSDQGVPVPDTVPGVSIAPADYGGFFTNNPTFTTTHSTYT